jgi:hypothetical protein
MGHSTARISWGSEPAPVPRLGEAYDEPSPSVNAMLLHRLSSIATPVQYASAGPPCWMSFMSRRQTLWLPLQTELKSRGLRSWKRAGGGDGRKRRSRGSLPDAEAVPGFVPAVVVSEALAAVASTDLSSTTLRLGRTEALSKSVPASSSSRMEIVTTKRRRIIVDAGVDVAAPGRVLDLLERRGRFRCQPGCGCGWPAARRICAAAWTVARARC